MKTRSVLTESSFCLRFQGGLLWHCCWSCLDVQALIFCSSWILLYINFDILKIIALKYFFSWPLEMVCCPTANTSPADKPLRVYIMMGEDMHAQGSQWDLLVISVRGDRTADCEEFVFRHFGGVMAELGVVRTVMTEQMCDVEKRL